MGKRCLIICDSRREIVARVARRMAEAFESANWDADLLWVDDKADTRFSPLELDGYVLLCVGSSMEYDLPSRAIVDLLVLQPSIKVGDDLPDTKFGVVFGTCSGSSSEQAQIGDGLIFYEAKLARLGFQSIGSFCFPAKTPAISGQPFQDRHPPETSDLGPVAEFVDRVLQHPRLQSVASAAST